MKISQKQKLKIALKDTNDALKGLLLVLVVSNLAWAWHDYKQDCGARDAVRTLTVAHNVITSLQDQLDAKNGDYLEMRDYAIKLERALKKHETLTTFIVNNKEKTK